MVSLACIERLAVLTAMGCIAAVTVEAQGSAFTPVKTTQVFEQFGSLSTAAAADFNRDGKQDLVVGGEEGLYLLEGTGNGNFKLARKLLYNMVTSVRTADLNRDGNPDIVAAAPSDHALLILLGRGDGTFAQPVLEVIPSGQFGPSALAVADLDGDGIPDVAVAADSVVATRLGNGDGTFRAGPTTGLPEPGIRLIAADFNGDGVPDLAAAMRVQSRIAILIGTGAGMFTVQTAGPGTGEYAKDIAAGDLNRDGNTDLVVATGSGVRTMLGNGDGTFLPGTELGVETSPLSIAVADVNGDGIPDAVAGCYYGGRIQTFLGNGDGTLRSGPVNGAPGDVPFIGLADFNGDGKPDLYAASYSSSTALAALGRGDGSFEIPVYLGRSELSVLRSADIDGDGTSEILAVISLRKTVVILDPQGTILAQVTLAATPTDAAVAEVDGDGIADLVMSTVQDLNDPNGTAFGAQIQVIHGVKNRQWTPSVAASLTGFPAALAVGDLNGDGLSDVVIADSSAGAFRAYAGNRGGTFAETASIQDGAAGALDPGMLLALDFNGDGLADFAAIQFHGQLTRLAGQRNGQLVELGELNTCSGATQALTADVNGDGRPDIVISCGSQVAGVQVVLSQDGDLAVQPEVAAGIGSAYSSVPIAAADFNQDGRIDLVALQAYPVYDPGGEVPTAGAVLLNSGGGDFRPAGLVTGVSSPSYALARDFDGDGRPDLVVLNAADGTLVFLKNAGLNVPTTPMWVVSAASFLDAPVALDSIVTIFGSQLANTEAWADSVPLPVSLAGVGVSVTDNHGTTLPAQLFYVSPQQINFLAPAGSNLGLAAITVTRNGLAAAQSVAMLASTSPAIFTANSNGKGAPAATVLRIKADGSQSEKPVFECPAGAGSCVPSAIDVSQPGESVHLQLFGTGIRGCSFAMVTIGGVAFQSEYAGRHPQYEGLDQINVALEPQLTGLGEVGLTVSSCVGTSNEVALRIQ